MKRKSTWKQAERVVAQRLGGQRTGNSGSNTVDVEHEWLGIEVKHRKELPQWLKEAVAQAGRNCGMNQLPIAIFHELNQRHDNDLVVMRLRDFQDWFGEVKTE